MVYNSMLKPSEEQGVAGNEASESLLEDIKKLNAQQRPDVPLCFIYAPISHVPMAVNTRARLTTFSFFFFPLSLCSVTLSCNCQVVFNVIHATNTAAAARAHGRVSSVCSSSRPLNRIPTIPNYG